MQEQSFPMAAVQFPNARQGRLPFNPLRQQQQPRLRRRVRVPGFHQQTVLSLCLTQCRADVHRRVQQVPTGGQAQQVWHVTHIVSCQAWLLSRFLIVFMELLLTKMVPTNLCVVRVHNCTHVPSRARCFWFSLRRTF